MELGELSKRLGSTISNMGELIDRAVFDNETEIINLNTAQLSRGIDSLGKFLEEYASEEYAKFKKSIGSEAPLGTPNLKLDGNFYEGFRLFKDDDNYIIFSDDEKTNSLVFKYGSDIFGLTEESIIINKPNLLESYLIEFRKSLGL